MKLHFEWNGYKQSKCQQTMNWRVVWKNLYWCHHFRYLITWTKDLFYFLNVNQCSEVHLFLYQVMTDVNEYHCVYSFLKKKLLHFGLKTVEHSWAIHHVLGFLKNVDGILELQAPLHTLDLLSLSIHGLKKNVVYHQLCYGGVGNARWQQTYQLISIVFRRLVLSLHTSTRTIDILGKSAGT